MVFGHVSHAHWLCSLSSNAYRWIGGVQPVLAGIRKCCTVSFGTSVGLFLIFGSNISMQERYNQWSQEPEGWDWQWNLPRDWLLQFSKSLDSRTSEPVPFRRPFPVPNWPICSADFHSRSKMLSSAWNSLQKQSEPMAHLPIPGVQAQASWYCIACGQMFHLLVSPSFSLTRHIWFESLQILVLLRPDLPSSGHRAVNRQSSSLPQGPSTTTGGCNCCAKNTTGVSIHFLVSYILAERMVQFESTVQGDHQSFGRTETRGHQSFGQGFFCCRVVLAVTRKNYWKSFFLSYKVLPQGYVLYPEFRYVQLSMIEHQWKSHIDTRSIIFMFMEIILLIYDILSKEV